MPLTRHLYELDEVVAAAQYCLRTGAPAHFWIWELIASKEEELATRTLHDAWVAWSGGRYPTALWTTGALQCSLMQKACYPPITITATEPTTRPLSSHTDRSESVVWRILDSALRRHKPAAALWLIQGRDAVPDLRLAARGPAKAEIQRLTDPVAIALCLARPAKQQMATVDAAAAALTWELWGSMTGRRKARVFAIPTAALHSGTTRGSLSSEYSNIADVREPLWLLSEGCRFWREAYAAHYSEELRDIFYDLYFPDDIPDEWSREDQEKSHGAGLAPAQKVDSVTPAQITVDVKDDVHRLEAKV